MADALFPDGIPAAGPAGTWQAVATEIDNSENPQAWRQLQARFPELAILGRAMPIVVSSADATANFLKVSDVEAGALSPADAARSLQAAPGRPVVIYFSIEEQTAVEGALGRPWNHPGAWPAAGPYKWDADWTTEPHINALSIATQYDSFAGYDISEVSPMAPSFPTIPSPPPPAPGGPPNVASVAAPVAIRQTPSGQGYWIFAADGGVFTFGDASFHGSAAGHTSAPIIDAAPSPTGKGYRLLGADGSVFDFGDAAYLGRVHHP